MGIRATEPPEAVLRPDPAPAERPRLEAFLSQAREALRGRAPAGPEGLDEAALAQGGALLAAEQQQAAIETGALERLANVLLASSEFLYVD